MTAFTIRGKRFGGPAYIAAVLGAVVVLALRRPEGVLHAGLWAEDGRVFARSAYLEPAYRSIFHSYNGYLHVLLRLWAEITTLLPAAETTKKEPETIAAQDKKSSPAGDLDVNAVFAKLKQLGGGNKPDSDER